MEILFLIGRILYGGFFVLNGLNHFKNRKMLADAAAAQKIPLPFFSVILSGLMMLVGGLTVICGRYTQIGLWLIIIFLVVAAFTMHKFWKETNPNGKMMQQIFFMRNMALTGAALMMMNIAEPWVYSVV